MAEPVGGHCQSPKTYGGPLLHHPHPAGTNEGKVSIDRGPQSCWQIMIASLASPSLIFLFSPRSLATSFFTTAPLSLFKPVFLHSAHCIYRSLQCRCISPLHPPLVTQVVFLLAQSRLFSSAIWPLYTFQIAIVYEIIPMYMILL